MLSPSFLALSFTAALLTLPAQAQLFDNLRALNRNIPVGSGATETDPSTGAPRRADGPKWICTGDFDNDGNKDFATCHLNGEISLGYGRGDGTFDPVVIMGSGTSDLRAILSADFNHDGLSDLAAAAPYDGKVTVLLAQSGRAFAAPLLLDSFKNARNLASGDFDGDGHADLGAAGPDARIPGYDPDTNPDPAQPRTGLVHFRGIGDGTFVRMGTVPEIGRPHQGEGQLKPVYSLTAFRRPLWTADWLAVTSETSSVIWLLAVNGAGVLELKQTLNWWGGGSNSTSSYSVDSLAVGTITRPAASREPDLISVMQDG
jgi:FG-GAP-like repeat